MNAPTTALVPAEGFGDTTATSSAGHFTVLTPARQARFLVTLADTGVVRLAARVAGVSAQTAYRARRASRGFSAAWDAALLAARQRAEQVLACRAIDGVEEAVFYHGEEVARRTRYDTRLLLAHLARLDRLEANEDVLAALATLDDDIDSLRRGEQLPDPEPRVPAQAGTSGGGAKPPEAPACAGAHGRSAFSPQDTVPGVPSCRTCSSIGAPCEHDPERPEGSFEDGFPPHAYPVWEPAMDDPRNWATGGFIPDFAAEIAAMDAARPAGFADVDALVRRHGGAARPVIRCQWLAFDHELPEWWTVDTEADLAAAYAAQDAADDPWGAAEDGWESEDAGDAPERSDRDVHAEAHGALHDPDPVRGG